LYWAIFEHGSLYILLKSIITFKGR